MDNSNTIRNKHKQYIFDAVKNYYKEPLVVSKANGFCLRFPVHARLSTKETLTW